MWPWRPKPGQSSSLIGPSGERLACKALKRAGMKILARNYRCPSGEIDIIAF
ncbi:MAG: YraN family protein, partial [Planctomycetes bacterium]|nr:YraN family protein [Planctomycetota bacterium]